MVDGNNWFLSAEVQTLSGTAPVGKYSLTTPTSNSNGYISFSPDVADADSTFIISLSVFIMYLLSLLACAMCISLTGSRRGC